MEVFQATDFFSFFMALHFSFTSKSLLQLEFISKHYETELFSGQQATEEAFLCIKKKKASWVTSWHSA